MHFRDLPSPAASEKSGEHFLTREDRCDPLGSEYLPETGLVAAELHLQADPVDKDQSDDAEMNYSSSGVGTVSMVAQPLLPLPNLTDLMDTDFHDEGSFTPNSELSPPSLDQINLSRVSHPSVEEEVAEPLSPLPNVAKPMDEDSDESRWVDNDGPITAWTDSSSLPLDQINLTRVPRLSLGKESTDIIVKEEEQDQPVRVTSTAPAPSQIPLTQPEAVDANGILFKSIM